MERGEKLEKTEEDLDISGYNLLEIPLGKIHFKNAAIQPNQILENK